jgi:hypothetical protein
MLSALQAELTLTKELHMPSVTVAFQIIGAYV